MRRILLFLLLFLSASNWQIIYTWNSSSHGIVAIIAYDLMDTESRNKVLDLIKHHPRYKEDFIDALPDTSKFWTQTEREQWIFAQIARWSDIARGFKDEMRDKYHHSTWHYINLGVFPNEKLKDEFGTSLPSNTNLIYNDASEFERMNIMEALGYISEQFESEATTKMEKAVLLCWLFHLVGDLHQPLHSSAMFTPRLFSKGDRGGNSIKVGKYNLHSTWDWALGGEREISKMADFSDAIRKDEKLNSIGINANEELKFNRWLEESYSLAKSIAYTEDVRDTVVSAENSNSTEFPSFTMNDEYKFNMEEAAKERVVQAGYRLSAILDLINL
ncbi:MAG: S1/P1 nuclease [Bacteroidetes bacterium]|nr:S1/P1 nuclease [Bacteroidota bacterium]